MAFLFCSASSILVSFKLFKRFEPFSNVFHLFKTPDLPPQNGFKTQNQVLIKANTPCPYEKEPTVLQRSSWRPTVNKNCFRWLYLNQKHMTRYLLMVDRWLIVESKRPSGLAQDRPHSSLRPFWTSAEKFSETRSKQLFFERRKIN